MRILHVFKDYYPPTHGGIEQHIHDVVHSLDEFQFSVLTSSRSRDLVIDDDHRVRVIRAPEFFRPVSTPVTPKWSRLLRLSGADLLHFHMPNPFGELMFLTSRTRTPMVVSYQGDIIGRRSLLPFFKPFQRRFLSRARKIVISSPGMGQSRVLSGFEEKFTIIPFGVDVDKWAHRPPEADEVRSQYESPIVLFIGRLAHYKGLDHLIKAMRMVDATCLIVGSGPKRAELEWLISDLGLERNVHLVGGIPESRKISYFHAADLFVLPSTSRAESFGISMLEAMACGVPAVSTELGTGTSWLNKHRSTGLVVPPGDELALAGAINSLLQNSDLRRRMGASAANRVKNNFTKSQMLEALSTLYKSLVTTG